MAEASAIPAVIPARATGAALAANLVGVGLARFGYTPLIPALIFRRHTRSTVRGAAT